MIAITGSDYKTLRWFRQNQEPLEIGLHETFGWATSESIRSRTKIREQIGYSDEKKPALFSLKISRNQDQSLSVIGSNACKLEQVSEKDWKIATPRGEFHLVDASLAQATPVIESTYKESRWPGIALSLVFAGVVGALVMTSPNKDMLEQKSLEETLASQKVVVLPKVKVVEPAVEPPKVEPQQVKPKDTGKQTPNNLGFLALLGKKNLTKALGGMPTNAKVTSPGAGLGGDKGSGGELLAGLGQGVKKATVGNSGVAGLGGLGKEGAGGGQGGQGSSFIGSGGGGKGLSDVSLSRDVELEGGLDKNVVYATIEKYISQVRACYEQGLRVRPGIMGQITMNFEIGKEGRLQYARVSKSSLGDQNVESCVSQRMMGWAFPKPVGGVHVKVSYPFHLRPAGA